ncbi:hypothetical protein F2Q69_00006214 [Brassica cretica]|uniref:Uncharacterized protein n=1 Tax=Brassica cretica TaxID=69181 RepID=A0A8S9P6C4_BRACR|nr:hypothetical protein F2Q69_00006214 [Brassica cretica]
MAYGYPENPFSEVIHLILSSSSLQMLGIGNLFLPLSQDGFLNAFSLATSMLGNRTRSADDCCCRSMSSVVTQVGLGVDEGVELQTPRES